MKKILVFGITDKPGGVESVIMNYYRNIDRSKLQFDFLCNTDVVAYEDEIKSLGGNIYRITARSKNFSKYRKELKEFFENNHEKYDTVWVNICSLANIDYLKMAKKYKIKNRIIHCHNSQNMDSKLRGLLHKFNRLFIDKYANVFWSCSEFSSPWFYSSKVRSKPTYRVINNAIDIDKYQYDKEKRKQKRKELGYTDKDIVIGNVGRMHFQKNQIFLIKIFEELLKLNPNYKLQIVGDGEDREKIENFIEERKLGDKVKLLGNRKDVNELYSEMDIYLFPSVFEGFGIVLLEAQCSGLMIFASKDVIPEGIKIVKDNFYSISLDQTEEEWARIINEKYKPGYERLSANKDIENAGYNIKNEAKKIEKVFLESREKYGKQN